LLCTKSAEEPLIRPPQLSKIFAIFFFVERVMNFCFLKGDFTGILRRLNNDA
jgi:hypothetical protein